jgi:two-component system, NarL family, captular synthesis response regulator RcsB
MKLNVILARMKINVILADDHPALVAGVEHTLNAGNTVLVTGTACNSGALVKLLDTTACDVLVADYSMPGGAHGDGLALLTYLRRQYPHLGIVVFTMVDNPAIIREIAKVGIRSVVHKSGNVDCLVSAIHAVYKGTAYFHDADGRSDITLVRLSTEQRGWQELSQREIEILRLYISGMTTNEIASHLNRSKQTISTHKVSAMRKLGIEREADLFRYAIDSRIYGAAPSGGVSGVSGVSPQRV